MAQIDNCGLTMFGLFEAFQVGLPETHFKLTHFPGIRGDSELRLGDGCVGITCKCTLFHEYSSAQLMTMLKTLRVAAGNRHGTLSIPVDAGIARTYTDVTFLGFEQDEYGPLPDIAGTLGTVGCYFVGGRLWWRQLLTSMG